MQTVVLDNPALGLPGQPADASSAADGDIVSGTSEESELVIPFGVMVAEGEGDDGVLLLAANSDTLAGIAVQGHHYGAPLELADNAVGLSGLKPGVTFGIGRSRRYHVVIEANVSKGDEVHCRAVADPDDGEQAGAFRGDDDGTDTINCSDFCKWVRGGEIDEDTGFGLAVLEVTMALSPLASADS